MTGNVAGLPPNFGGWQLFFHRGLDLSGGTQLTLPMGNFPTEPLVQAAGNNHDRIEVQLAGVTASQAANVIGRRDQLVITTWVPDSSITGQPFPGYRSQMTQMTADML